MSTLPWPMPALTRALLLAALVLFAVSCGDDPTATESGIATDDPATADTDIEEMTDEPIMATTTVEVPIDDGQAMGETDSTVAVEDGSEAGGDEGHGHSHGGTGETIEMAAADADVVIEGSLQGGELTVDDRRFSVAEGQTVGVIFTSDETDEIHLHGYDILADIGPGQTTELVFLADSPGTFEVEVEGSGRFLFEIQVR